MSNFKTGIQDTIFPIIRYSDDIIGQTGEIIYYVHLNSTKHEPIMGNNYTQNRYHEVFGELQQLEYDDPKSEEIINELKRVGTYDEKVYWKPSNINMRIIQPKEAKNTLSFTSNEVALLSEKFKEHLAQRDETLLREYYD
jgi:hypothetical protein